MKKILLFGGSFDPIHYGHLKIAEYAYKTLNVDKCYFVPSKNPRWKEPNCDIKHRLKMLKLALKDYKNFKISLIEVNSNEIVNYTYDTIVKLGKLDKVKYYFLIGFDQLNQLHEWYKIDELSKMIQFVVYRRGNQSINEENFIKYNCMLIDGPEIDVSSTRIRYLNKLYTPKIILDYIEKNNLYYVGILKNYINEKRLKHSFSVANLAFDIAYENNKDPYKAYQAGLIHDIAKGISKDEELKIMKEHFPEYISMIGSWGYHQFLSVKIAKDILKIEDEEILSAVKFHATGNIHMPPLAKIIYAADKLDPLRGWDSHHLIELCKRNYKEGFKAVLKDNISYFEDNHIDYSNELTKACITYYLGENKDGRN